MWLRMEWSAIATHDSITSSALSTQGSGVSLSSIYMLSAPAVDLTFDDDDWNTPQIPNKFYRAASVGSWAVTSIGRGFDWDAPEDDETIQQAESVPPYSPRSEFGYATKGCAPKHNHPFINTSPIIPTLTPTSFSARTLSATPTTESFMVSSSESRTSSPSIRPTPLRSPSSPRPRRRSSRQRVSLIAGRVSIIPLESPSPSSLLPQSLRRSDSSGSFISVATSTRAPSPTVEKESFLGKQSISDFHIEGEIGRGAYGLVKRGREIRPDGSLGVSSPSPGHIFDYG